MSGVLDLGRLQDPALRQPDGSARLPLPNGSRVRIETGAGTVLARVGGPAFDLGPSGGRAVVPGLVPAT